MAERRNFSKKEKEYAWDKASSVSGKNPQLYKKDKCNNLLHKSSYGKDTPMGWNVDHSNPLANGGTYHKNNLQALQTSQNKSKSCANNYSYKSAPKKGVTPTKHTRSKK